MKTTVPKKTVTPENDDPMRYIQNAREILSEKAGKRGQYYSDEKYVKMACNTAWNGVLVALNQKMTKEGFKFPAKNRMNVNIYKEYLASKNKTMLKNFNSAYNYLHLLGGYDGDLNISTSKTGIELAITIIEWCK